MKFLINQILRGSFSYVLIATIARVGAFFSIFEIYKICTPPNSEKMQNFVSFFFVIFLEISQFFLVNFVVFRMDFRPGTGLGATRGRLLLKRKKSDPGSFAECIDFWQLSRIFRIFDVFKLFKTIGRNSVKSAQTCVI